MNHAIMARRAQENGAITCTPNTGLPMGQNLLTRVDLTAKAPGPVTRTRATKMTGAARCASGSGKRSLWAASQNYRTGITVDSRWSA